MNIIITPDFSYQEQAKVLIKSILWHHLNVDFYVINNSLSEFWFNGLNKIAQRLNSRIINVSINNTTCSDWKTTNYLSEASYYRFYAQELPIDKAIYLDCDIVVNGSLENLWNIVLENNLVGAVPDVNMATISKIHQIQNTEHTVIQQLKDKAPSELIEVFPKLYSEYYFNSGMLLLNLKLWKQENLAQKLTEIANKYSEYLFAGDQCVLNLLCSNRWKFLDCSYNYMPFLSERLHESIPNASMVELLDSPTIIHYAGPKKPWHKGVSNKFTDYYWYFYHLDWQDILNKWDQ